jgi:hypothetical protein
MWRMGFGLGRSLRDPPCLKPRKDEGNENYVELLSTNEDGTEWKGRERYSELT